MAVDLLGGGGGKEASERWYAGEGREMGEDWCQDGVGRFTASGHVSHRERNLYEDSSLQVLSCKDELISVSMLADAVT